MKMPLPYTTVPQKQTLPIELRISCVPGTCLVRKKKSANNHFCLGLMSSAKRSFVMSPSMRLLLPSCVR